MANLSPVGTVLSLSQLVEFHLSLHYIPLALPRGTPKMLDLVGTGRVISPSNLRFSYLIGVRLATTDNCFAKQEKHTDRLRAEYQSVLKGHVVQVLIGLKYE